MLELRETVPDPLRPGRELTTLRESWLSASERYEDREFIGYRPKLDDGSYGPYVFDDATTFNAKIDRLATVLTSTCGLGPTDKVSIFTPNCPEWVMAEQACNRMSIITCPFYDSLTASEINFILAHAGVATIVCAASRMDVVLDAVTMEPKIDDSVVVKSVIVIQDLSEVSSSTIAAFESRNIRIINLYPALDQISDSEIVPEHPPSSTSIASIIYTSGTTGTPKGVVLSHANFTAAMAGYFYHGIPQLSDKAVYMSYLPLAHVLERCIFAVGLYVCGRVCFYSGDLGKIVEDVGMCAPNVFTGVPRVFNKIYDGIQKKVAALPWYKRALFNAALAYKKHRMRSSGAVESIIDPIFADISAGFGGNLELFISGGAPLAEHVQEFMMAAFSARFIQGYGLTECVAACAVQHVSDASVDNVGPPCPCVELRLAPVEEMGHTPGGPRGEIFIRGPNLFKEYYRLPDETAKAIDSEGWFATGDVGEWRPARLGQPRRIAVVDRKKNIFKMAQGEYISPEVLEAAYGQVPEVDQVWVHGDSGHYKLIAVMVIAAETVAAKLGITREEATELINAQDARVVGPIMQQCDAVRRAAGLKALHGLGAVHFQNSEFSPEDGLLTATFKLKRPQLVKFYAKEIAGLYAGMKTPE